ncbi:MAG: dienelactone hydrolase family protein [Methylococcaceae bacterium]
MEIIKKLVILFASITICIANNAQAEIRSEVVNYQIGGQPFQGYLSYDDAITTKRPGILVVHEWWGHNAYARKRADMLAAMGYTAFALDMYGAGKLAKHPDDAQKFMQATLADMHVAEARFNAAVSVLQKHSTVSSNKIAAIGYCFGGGTVLHMARVGADLAGVVSFHGSLATKTTAKAGQVKAKILVFNGADDPFVTAEQITGLKQEMKTAGADLKFVNYSGVKHSFTNSEADVFGKRFNLPLIYNAEADKDSWQRMQVFLGLLF